MRTREGVGAVRAGARNPRPGLCAIATVAGLIFLLSAAASARDGERTTVVTRDGGRTTVVTRDDWDDWPDFNRTLLQMQRESISSQEERAREAGRARRRDEVEKSREKSAAEHEAYYDAILEDSQAALRAPLGAYYRKPGYSTAEGPGSGAATIEVGGATYRYDQGIFWLQQGTGSIVVTAPVGAVVDRLPQGVTRVAAMPAPVWYFFGAFFGERDGAYEIVKPPAGLTVFYLPDGYTQESVKGAGLYRFGDVFFKPVFVQGVLAYQVVEP